MWRLSQLIWRNRVPRLRCFLSLLFGVGMVFSAAGRTVLVSEMMAANRSTLLDAEGDTPDWIELYNNTGTNVDLAGWHLTDCSTNLAQWTFPATNLPPHSLLLVFASGKDRAVPGRELHTNFKLSANGEYVGLSRPDGTLEDGFAFSAQEPDVSYGRIFPEEPSDVFLDFGTPCSAHIPTNAADSAGWREAAFDDSAWKTGTLGVGFDRGGWAGDPYSPLIGLDVGEMYDGNPSVYVRIPFPFDPEKLSNMHSLVLNMKYDDGFVAYLNGTEVARSHFSGTPQWNSPADEYNSDSNAQVFEPFDISEHRDLLHDGTNLLTIQGLNARIRDIDFLILPQLAICHFLDLSSVPLQYITRPTPGAENVEGGLDGFLPAPAILKEHGFFNAPFSVAISNAEENAQIRYTVDGSTPTTNSPLYTAPLTVSQTTVLRARAFRDNWAPSETVTKTYLFLDDVVREPQRFDTSPTGQELWFGMDSNVVDSTWLDTSNQPVTVKESLLAVPTLSIVTDEENLFDPATGIYVNAAEEGWERPASFELINPDGSKGFNIPAGLRIRGGWSRHNGFPKHSFRLFFRKEYGAGKLKFPLFGKEGASEFDKIDLRTPQNYCWVNQQDPRNTFLRDVLVRDLAREMGQPYTRSRYYHLYINGKYWGLYQTEERPEARYAATYFGGDPEDYDTVKTGNWTDPDELRGKVRPTDGNLDAYFRLFSAMTNGIAYDNALYFSVQGLDLSGRPDPSKEKLLDLRNMIDYLLLIYHSAAADNCITWFGGNTRLNNMFVLYNRNHPDGFKWIEHDCEHAYDTTRDPPDRTGPFIHENFALPEYFNAQTLHEHLSSNAEYRIAFADEVWRTFYNDGPLSISRELELIDKRAAQIDRAIIAHSARWGNATNLNCYTWRQAVENLKNYIAVSNRTATTIEQLRADGLIPSIQPPVISRPSGEVEAGTPVSLSGEGTIYCTTDGTDPRAIGGAPSVAPWSGEDIPIGHPTLLKARARSASGEWSALAEAFFIPPGCPLAVTELMYHAASNQLDFIEIQNRSSQPVPMVGYDLDGTLRAELPARTLASGAFGLLVRDLEAFTNAYPAAAPAVLGVYQGDLDNDDGKIELRFFGKKQIEFSYSDARNWPQAADGGGHSLVPLQRALDSQAGQSLDYGGNWRASAFIGGSPGAEDPNPVRNVLLNEIVAHTDTGKDPPFDSNDRIELFNASSSPVDISGWRLADRFGGTNAWTIPTGTILPAGGLICFDEDDFHPGRTEGFGIDKAGEMVALIAPDRVADVVAFKSQENGRSLGRFPDGESWQMTLPTPAATNRLAEQPVYMQQVMYHPAGDDDRLEYVLITNAGNESVCFGSGNMGWRVTGEVELCLPADRTLEPGDSVCLVSFDPEADPATAQRFRRVYGFGEDLFLSGPWKGHLSNHRGRVALERPQEPDWPKTNISWVVVDELFYSDRAPWPDGADGTGFPLVRVSRTNWACAASGGPDEDPDHDGQSNIEEYLAGTNPSDSASLLRLHTQFDPQGTLLSWEARPGRTYDLLWAPDPTRGFRYLFAGQSCSANTWLDPNQAGRPAGFYKLRARLPSKEDTDADALSDGWEIRCFGSLSARPMDDADGDGLSNIDEYLAGTDPSDDASCFKVAQRIQGDEVFLEWGPVCSNRTYTLLFAPDLSQPFQVLETDLPYTQNRYTNHISGGTATYRVEVDF